MRHFFPGVRDRLTRAMVNFLLQCNGDGLLLKTMRSQCFLDTHYHCYWCDYLDLTIVDDLFRCYCFFLRLLVSFHGFSFVLSLPSSTLQFFTKPSGPMFLQGFFANHRSNHAIFAMYRSSLVREFFNTDRLGWDLICFSQVKAGTLKLAPKLNTGIYDWLEFYQLNLFLFFRKRY